MRIGTKMAPVPGVKGTATSTREPSGYLLRLRKLMPPFDRSSQTTTSSAKPRRRTHARTRAFTRVRLRRGTTRSEEHTSELQSLTNLVCRLLLEKKKKKQKEDTRVTDIGKYLIESVKQ